MGSEQNDIYFERLASVERRVQKDSYCHGDDVVVGASLRKLRMVFQQVRWAQRQSLRWSADILH